MNTNNLESYYSKALVAIFFIYSIIYYIPFFIDGVVVRGDDFNWEFFYQTNLSRLVSSKWSFDGFLGEEFKPAGLKFTNLLQLLIPVFISTNLFMLIIFSLLFLATYLFFRAWSFNKIVSMLIAILVTFSPNFHSFIRTGHVTKIILTVFIMFSFAFITLYFRSNRFNKIYGLLTAISLAFAFGDGDPQVFLYFLPFFTGYVLWLMFVKHDNKKVLNFSIEKTNSSPQPLLERLKIRFKNNSTKNYKVLLIALLTFIFAIPFMYSWYGALVKESGDINSNLTTLIPVVKNAERELSDEQVKQNELQNWLWATQWSFHPTETLSLIIPGFFGITSQSEKEPYWGKTGQTEGWEQHRQGYRNYSLMDNYLGVFMVLFMIYGFVFLPTSFRLVMGFLLILFLLLSYGKFAFLYEYFYALPMVKNFRNPNRFLQLVHFVVSIIFGFGLYHLYILLKDQFSSTKNTINKTQNKSYQFFKISSIVIIVIGVLGAIGLVSENKSLIAHFSNFYDYQTANLIVSNMMYYWIKGCLVYFIASILLLFFIVKVNKNNVVIWIAVMLGFGLLDLYLINNKYYMFEKPEHRNLTNIEKFFRGEVPGYEQFKVDENEYFKKRIFYYMPKGSFQSQYANYLFYNGRIPLTKFQYTLVRKGLPPKVETYLTTLNNNDLRFLKLGGVSYLVSEIFIRDPMLTLVYADELKHLNETVYVYKLEETLPYLYLKDNIEFGEGVEGILGRMNQPSFNIYSHVMVNQKVNELNLIPKDLLGKVAPISGNELVLKTANENDIEIKTVLKGPAVLIYNSMYSERMKAYSDGDELPHFPVNYFFNGYYVNPENKNITIQFEKDYVAVFLNWFLIVHYALVILAIYFLFKNHNFAKSKFNKI